MVRYTFRTIEKQTNTHNNYSIHYFIEEINFFLHSMIWKTKISINQSKQIETHLNREENEEEQKKTHAEKEEIQYKITRKFVNSFLMLLNHLTWTF